MWSLDVRSPRSDAQCRVGDQHGAFIQTQRNFMSVLSLRVNIGFTSRWCARLEGERHTDVASRTLRRTHIARILTRIPLKTKL